MTTPAPDGTPDDRGGRRVLAGVASVLLGALLGMLALTALPWYRGGLGGILPNGSSISDIRDRLAFYGVAIEQVGSDYASRGVAPAYFGWLALVLLVVAVVGGVVAAGTDRLVARASAAVAALASLAGIVLGLFAVQLVRFDRARITVQGTQPPGWGDWVRTTGPGAWAMLLAFLLTGVGAVLAAGGRERLRTLLGGEDEEDAADVPEVEGPAEPEPAPRRRGEDW